MAESSWAAAGMLAAGDPENPPALRPLAELSALLYQQFLADVERLSGEPVPIRTTRAIQGARQVPVGFRELNRAELAAMAPGMEAGSLRFSLSTNKALTRETWRGLCQRQFGLPE